MSKVKQYYGIKFPFTANNIEGFFIDLNKNIEDKKTSEMLHVVLTPKGTRIREPNFGTDLIKFIFEPNDELTFENIKSDIIENVSKYVSGLEVNDVNVTYGENDIYLSIIYSVTTGKNTENKQVVVKL